MRAASNCSAVAAARAPSGEVTVTISTGSRLSARRNADSMSCWSSAMRRRGCMGSKLLCGEFLAVEVAEIVVHEGSFEQQVAPRSRERAFGEDVKCAGLGNFHECRDACLEAFFRCLDCSLSGLLLGLS